MRMEFQSQVQQGRRREKGEEGCPEASLVTTCLPGCSIIKSHMSLMGGSRSQGKAKGVRLKVKKRGISTVRSVPLDPHKKRQMLKDYQTEGPCGHCPDVISGRSYFGGNKHIRQAAISRARP